MFAVVQVCTAGGAGKKVAATFLLPFVDILRYWCYIICMKTIFALSNVIFLICVFSACPIYEQDPYNIPLISLTGTVTITRNGIPLNHENFPIHGVSEDTYHQRIWLRAYLSPDGSNVGYVRSIFSNETDLALGKYTWVMDIDSSRIPGLIFFEVIIPSASPTNIMKITEGIWIQNNNSIVDIGTVNFEVIRLFGNLPVTFNGNPPSEGVSSLSTSPRISIIQSDDLYSYPMIIQPNGDWIWDTPADSFETQLVFRVDAREKGGFFSRYLNPDHTITIPDTDKEIIFPDYPNLDFEAFSLEGTVNISDHSGELRWLELDFYHRDFPPDSLIGRVTISNHSANENGLFEWSLLVPVFPLPDELIFRLYINDGEGRRRTYFDRLEIGNETDLSNINLGPFAFD